MSEGIVLTSIDSRGIAEVVLNRPERNNAYNGAMIAELINSFTSLYNNNNVKVVLIKGNWKLEITASGTSNCYHGNILSLKKNLACYHSLLLYIF